MNNKQEELKKLYDALMALRALKQDMKKYEVKIKQEKEKTK